MLRARTVAEFRSAAYVALTNERNRRSMTAAVRAASADRRWPRRSSAFSKAESAGWAAAERPRFPAFAEGCLRFTMSVMVGRGGKVRAAAPGPPDRTGMSASWSQTNACTEFTIHRVAAQHAHCGASKLSGFAHCVENLTRVPSGPSSISAWFMVARAPSKPSRYGSR